MSTFTAVGPALDLDGPLPVAPRHSLLATEGVVVSEDATRVLNGVNVYGYPTDTPSLWEPCSEGTYRTKGSDSDQPQPRFDAFVAYLPITCSTLGMGDPDSFAERSARVLAATLSMGVEEALAAGVTQSTNPFFGDANVDDLTGGTAVSPTVGFAYLEEAIGTTGRQGLIHATPAVISARQSFPQGDMLVSANGTRVVSGDGYQGVDTPWLDTPGTTEDWIFATGPVQVHMGPVVLTNISEILDRSDNTVTFRAERYVLALWDTALQAAVLVDWAT